MDNREELRGEKIKDKYGITHNPEDYTEVLARLITLKNKRFSGKIKFLNNSKTSHLGILHLQNGEIVSVEGLKSLRTIIHKLLTLASEGLDKNKMINQEEQAEDTNINNLLLTREICNCTSFEKHTLVTFLKTMAAQVESNGVVGGELYDQLQKQLNKALNYERQND